MTLVFQSLVRGRRAGLLPIAVASALTACSDGFPATAGDFVGPGDGAAAELCSIPQELILSGARKDGIPALTNPEMALVGQPGTEYLREDDRVIGLIFEGEPIAVPLNIMWWHEVVNLNGATSSITVTHCPLTGSSLAFDRHPVSGAEFGVSGLLFKTNLIMYDRTGSIDSESFWPQMLRGARCGPSDGTRLPMVPIVETTWRGWKELHPDTRVVTENTTFDRPYQSYPYGDYDSEQNRSLLFPIGGPIDSRRPPKERVLGIPIECADCGGLEPKGELHGGFAFPFGELDELGEVGVVNFAGYAVLWERSVGGAMAFRPRVGITPLTLKAENGKIVDVETGSEWRVDGRAVSGPLEGQSLEPVEEAFVSFWFAWDIFHPLSELWNAPRITTQLP